MIEREVRVSSDETVAEQEEEKVNEEKTGEEQGGVVGEDGNVVATAYGNTATTTTVAARNWNEVDLIDWEETDSQQQQAVQPQPHGAGLVETSSPHHPVEEKNSGDVTTPSQQEWNLMDLDLFKGDASVVVPARTAAGGVSAISSSTSVPPAAEAPEITRTKSMGHMESSTDMGCAAATTAQQVTDTTGKKEEEEEGASSIQQRPLWRRRADNPAYNRSKSATHVLESRLPLGKPLLQGAAMEELKDHQEAREEAKRIAKEETERAQDDELLKFACPEPPPQSSTHGKQRMKSSKGVSRFFHRIMASREEKVHSPSNTLNTRDAKHGPVEARQAKLVIPRSTFLKDLISPIHHASSKAAIKTGPPPHLASKQELHFETVESQQKDGPAWTVEEYMIQNNRWKEVEEVGGIENFLFNLQFDDFDGMDGADDDDDDDDDW
ncbi:unnamed protein product [Sphagnum jensenii]|uniref:Uncharacterized protein n=1 Tax=Sphagnum jensenii TaxID=128206 RepID=A0ABP1AW09_9BRYO